MQSNKQTNKQTHTHRKIIRKNVQPKGDKASDTLLRTAWLLREYWTHQLHFYIFSIHFWVLWSFLFPPSHNPRFPCLFCVCVCVCVCETMSGFPGRVLSRLEFSWSPPPPSPDARAWALDNWPSKPARYPPLVQYYSPMNKQTRYSYAVYSSSTSADDTAITTCVVCLAGSIFISFIIDLIRLETRLVTASSSSSSQLLCFSLILSL
jgi:hypothetical protein